MLLGLLLIAAACGSDDDSAVGDDDQTTDATESTSGDDGGDAGSDDDGDAAEPAPAVEGTTLTVAVDWDVAPTTFDGIRYADEQFPFYSLVYDALFMTDATGQIVPGIVKEFEDSEDFMQTTLTLHEGATFADGSPLNAEVVKANLDRRGDDALNTYNVFTEGEEGEIASVEVVDEYVLAINWGKPTDNGPELMSDTPGIIIGPAGLADSASLEAAPDGSGPYSLVADRTTRGNTYGLVKNADYWNADAWVFDNIVFDVIIDPQARANAAISGQADIAIDIAPSLLDLVRSEGTLAAVGGTMGSLPVLDKMGITHPAFEFVETRHAIAHAIDRDAIVEALVPGARPTSQMFPETAEGYDPALDDKYSYDPDKARELLASVGYGDGFEFEFVVLGAPSDIQLAVQQMLSEELNITLTWVTATSTDQLFASVRTQPILISPWSLGDRPAGFITGAVVNGFMNQQGAESEAITSVLGPALGGDPDALAALNQAMTDEGWWITMYESKFYAAYNADTVQEPVHAGTNNYLVMSDIKPA